MSTTVTISKTTQLKQYEPLTVTITRTIDDSNDTVENRKKLYNSVGIQVKKLIDKESKRYAEEE